MDAISIFLIFLLVIVVLLPIFIYNNLVKKREIVRNDLRQIDIQLDRRYKVFESLISAVNKYMDYEKTTLKEVVSLRSRAQEEKKSGDERSRIVSENEISKRLLTLS